MSDIILFKSRYVTERTLKRTPYNVAYNGASISLIPDGFQDFRQRRSGMADLSLSLILEHDRGTEQQEHFRRRWLTLSHDQPIALLEG